MWHTGVYGRLVLLEMLAPMFKSLCRAWILRHFLPDCPSIIVMKGLSCGLCHICTLQLWACCLLEAWGHGVDISPEAHAEGSWGYLDPACQPHP